MSIDWKTAMILLKKRRCYRTYKRLAKACGYSNECSVARLARGETIDPAPEKVNRIRQLILSELTEDEKRRVIRE